MAELILDMRGPTGPIHVSSGDNVRAKYARTSFSLRADRNTRDEDWVNDWRVWKSGADHAYWIIWDA